MKIDLIIITATLLLGMVAIFGIARGVQYTLQTIALATGLATLLVIGGAL